MAAALRLPAQSDYNEAIARTRSGDWAAACRIAGELIEARRATYAVHNLAGLCAARNGNRQAAEAAFRLSINLNPDFADSRNNLGIELVRSGRYADALDQFDAALRADPKNVTSLYNAGRIELDTGKHLAAVNHLSAALALAPGDLSIRVAFAEGLALAGQESRAREVLKEVLQQRSGLAAELLSLARAAASKGRYANARAILAGIYPGPQHEAEWNAISGYADYKLGNPRRAEERLRRALSLDPLVEEYWMNLSELLLFYHSYDAAIAFLEVGLGKLPDSARLHLAMGVSKLAANERDEKGIEHLETALQLQPDSEAGLWALCEAHHRNQDWRQLEQTAIRWLERRPEAFAAYYYQALTLIQSERIEEAQRLLRRSIEMQPRFAASRIAMGKLLNQADKPAEALPEFLAAVEASPEDPAAKYQLSITYRKLGELEKSRQALEAFKHMKARQKPWQIVFQLSR